MVVIPSSTSKVLILFLVDVENVVGFYWNSYKFRWEEMFKRLLAYKGENGDCNVRSSYSDKQLPIWI